MVRVIFYVLMYTSSFSEVLQAFNKVNLKAQTPLSTLHHALDSAAARETNKYTLNFFCEVAIAAGV